MMDKIDPTHIPHEPIDDPARIIKATGEYAPHRDYGDESDHIKIDEFSTPEFNFGEAHLTIEDAEGNKKVIDVDLINLVDDEDHYESYQIVAVSREDFESGNVKCPFTGTKDIYRISDGIYASFETEQPFMIVIEDD